MPRLKRPTDDGTERDAPPSVLEDLTNAALVLGAFAGLGLGAVLATGTSAPPRPVAAWSVARPLPADSMPARPADAHDPLDGIRRDPGEGGLTMSLLPLTVADGDR
jgi:hypothetical protein